MSERMVPQSDQGNWLVRVSLAYLLLPFLIFSLTYIKIWISLPIVGLIGWSTWKIWKPRSKFRVSYSIHKSDLIIGLTVLGVWVFFSGIGGFTFQNSDHHIRNAIFSDLIRYDWPVYYSSGLESPTSPAWALTYYIGFWLPAAIFGKLFGWQSANVFLFLWAWLGVFLTAALLKRRIRSTLLASALLLVFFSGMDILGTLLVQSFLPWERYPTLWPPITHLEWWAPTLQFSSFTTQLFWVFNQAIPAWICMALILNTSNHRIVFLIWSLCFFFSPLPALGMLPFTFLVIPRKSFNPENLSFNWQSIKPVIFLKHCLKDVADTISIENILGGSLILSTSYLYFSGNQSASNIKAFQIERVTVVLIIPFLILEGLLLWSLFFKEQRRNLWWYVTGAMLILSPMIIFGSSIDFCMRASIPALFMLMIWSGEAIFKKPGPKYQLALIMILACGAFTPLYEINRTLYRIAIYHLGMLPRVDESTFLRGVEQPNPYPELDHPATLTADLYPSLTVFDPEGIQNFLGENEGSFFFKYLANPPSHR